jgi:hypothetical protein
MTFILEFQNTPTLFLDFSDKGKEDVAILSNQVDELTQMVNDRSKKMKIMDDNLKYYNEEV